MSCDRAGRAVFKNLGAQIERAKTFVRRSHFFSKRLGQLAVYAVAILVPLASIGLANFALAGSDASGARSGVPRFTLNQAILTALRQNPTIQIARQEIERTKGLYIQVRAEA